MAQNNWWPRKIEQKVNWKPKIQIFEKKIQTRDQRRDKNENREKKIMKNNYEMDLIYIGFGS